SLEGEQAGAFRRHQEPGGAAAADHRHDQEQGGRAFRVYRTRLLFDASLPPDNVPELCDALRRRLLGLQGVAARKAGVQALAAKDAGQEQSTGELFRLCGSDVNVRRQWSVVGGNGVSQLASNRHSPDEMIDLLRAAV